MAATKTATPATAPEKVVEVAPTIADETIPVGHVFSKADLTVIVPKTAGQYGVTFPGGSQILYEVSPRDEEGLGSIQVHPDHLARVLYTIEGARQEKPPTLTPEQQAAEDARPIGRQPGPPLSVEEVAAYTAANPLPAPLKAEPAKKVEAKPAKAKK